MRGIVLALAMTCALSSVALGGTPKHEFTDEFPLEDCWFVSRGGNAFFNLTPGRQLYLSNQQCVAEGKCDELEEVWITVLEQTRTVVLNDDGRKRRVTTRVVEERETVDGELAEISRNYFATCRPSNDVYYFGEQVDNYENGEIVNHDGQWLAGQHGAEPGIIMVDSGFILGARYYQELAPGVALDRAEHVASDLEIQTPAFGAGLDGLLRFRRRALYGILNGIDTDVWRARRTPGGFVAEAPPERLMSLGRDDGLPPGRRRFSVAELLCAGLG